MIKIVCGIDLHSWKRMYIDIFWIDELMHVLAQYVGKLVEKKEKEEVSFFDHSILSQLYDVRVKDNHKIYRTKTDQELNNGIVNSQLSSNKLFSIDSFSLSLCYSDRVTLRQLHTHRILCSCAHIKSFLFSLSLLVFFWLFIQSSLHHHHRSFVCSIDQHSWEIELYVEILYYTIAHAFTMEIIRYACVNMM